MVSFGSPGTDEVTSRDLQAIDNLGALTVAATTDRAQYLPTEVVLVTVVLKNNTAEDLLIPPLDKSLGKTDGMFITNPRFDLFAVDASTGTTRPLTKPPDINPNVEPSYSFVPVRIRAGQTVTLTLTSYGPPGWPSWGAPETPGLYSLQYSAFNRDLGPAMPFQVVPAERGQQAFAPIEAEDNASDDDGAPRFAYRWVNELRTGSASYLLISSINHRFRRKLSSQAAIDLGFTAPGTRILETTGGVNNLSLASDPSSLHLTVSWKDNQSAAHKIVLDRNLVRLE